LYAVLYAVSSYLRYLAVGGTVAVGTAVLVLWDIAVQDIVTYSAVALHIAAVMRMMHPAVGTPEEKRLELKLETEATSRPT